MCGYSGFILSKSSEFYEETNLKQKFILASQNISHRGNEPLRTKFYENVLLSHTRLGFQDLEKSSQPFVSPDGSWVIIFNGEIYNFKNIKEKIKSEFQDNFKTTGDTEVILMGFCTMGQKLLNI